MNHQPPPSSGGRGGYRPGAGRKPGALNAMARDAREAAKLTGRLPHEILLDMARGLPVKTFFDSGVVDEDGKPVFAEKYVPLDLEQMKDAAKAAAPYYAPKISTVEVIAGVSDDDLDSIIAGLAAETGFGARLDGEGEETEAAQGQGSSNQPRARTRVRV